MNKKHVLSSIYLSNALEFFDYTLFGSLSVIVHTVFFPSYISVKSVLFTFCLSLIVRPLGGYVFGYIGDKVSRALSLKLSVASMAFASLLVAFCPSYDSIGLPATFLIILSRLLQGISAGGEYNGAAIFSIETLKLPASLISGYLTSSAVFGLVIAILVAQVITLEGLPPSFWRVGFLFGSLLGLFSLYLRRNIGEIKKDECLQPSPQAWCLGTSRRVRFFLVFLIGGQTGALAYFVFVGVAPFLKTHGLVFNPRLIGIPLFIASLVSILVGKLSQKIAPSFLLKSGLIFSGVVFPLSLVLGINGYLNLWILFLLMGVSIGSHGALQHAFFQNLAPLESRQRFISLAFSLGTGILTTLCLLATQYHTLISLSVFSLISLSALSLYLYEERKNDHLYPITKNFLRQNGFFLQTLS